MVNIQCNICKEFFKEEEVIYLDNNLVCFSCCLLDCGFVELSKDASTTPTTLDGCDNTLNYYEANYYKEGGHDEYFCHKVTQVYPNFFLCSGSYSHVNELITKHSVDCLVPLSGIHTDIWRGGWSGDVLYIPILDFGVLPQNILDRYVKKVLCMLDEGLKVGMFCGAGHGRTGYFASCVLGKIDSERYNDPIASLRAEYCRLAVETNEQVDSISKYLGKDFSKYQGTTEVNKKAKGSKKNKKKGGDKEK